MLQLTLLEKLTILFDLVLASPFFIFLLIFTILVFVILLDSKNYKKRQVQTYITGIYMLVFIAVIIKHHSSFLSVIDYLVNNIFIIFYFPNIAIYSAMIIFINIIMLKSIFSKKDKVIRTLNMASYSIIMYLMLLIIYTISTEQVNVYSELTLYSNKTLLVLIEISNILFVIWMVLLLINKLLDFLETKGIRTKSRIPNIYPDKEIITIEKEVVKEIEKEVIKEVEKEVIKEVEVVKEVVKEVIKEVPVEKIVYKEKTEDIFTKEDYLVMLNILRNKEGYKK